jgi:hypothetical protein
MALVLDFNDKHVAKLAEVLPVSYIFNDMRSVQPDGSVQYAMHLNRDVYVVTFTPGETELLSAVFDASRATHTERVPFLRCYMALVALAKREMLAAVQS